ncbi:3-hydroxyisobutyryl-CoA hydrolase-like protein 1, mitochondrial [Primulina huaijiensis]|uniref:3-hydroxyisobutyryl-CoA hydrolase-like protein 1, mitochondrial n=1 Tax=Primulina huaijiensis TaxID=1492673 RepID=UPI003CC71177
MYSLHTYLKPHVAILNGITMGGGAGISIPGMFQLATDRTIFATPETLIGFHPDAGASFRLSHLPGYLGEYVALTGEKLSGAQMASCGLATHYSLFTKLPLIEEQLGNLVTDCPSVLESSLENHRDPIHLDQTSVIHRIESVNRCFCHDTVEEIIESLKNEAAKTNDAWCVSTLNKLKEAAPLSLKVSLRSIREGRFQTLDRCLVREYRMSVQGITGQISHDFCEGVRAKLVDKDFAPKWDPPSLEHVSQDMVDQYFSPISSLEPELELPTKQRESIFMIYSERKQEEFAGIHIHSHPQKFSIMEGGFVSDTENSNSLEPIIGKTSDKGALEAVVPSNGDCVFGPVPSRVEVRRAISDLQRFVNTHSASKSELDGVQQLLYRLDQTNMLQSPGYAKFHDAFSTMQVEPAFRNTVASISSDKAVWEAIQSNKAVQDLRGSIFAAKKKTFLNCLEEEPDIIALIMRWILNFTRSRVLELAESFGLLVNEMIQSSPKDKPASELENLLEEKVRSSLLLSIIIMLIVVITRS